MLGSITVVSGPVYIVMRTTITRNIPKMYRTVVYFGVEVTPPRQLAPPYPNNTAAGLDGLRGHSTTLIQPDVLLWRDPHVLVMSYQLEVPHLPGLPAVPNPYNHGPSYPLQRMSSFFARTYRSSLHEGKHLLDVLMNGQYVITHSSNCPGHSASMLVYYNMLNVSEPSYASRIGVLFCDTQTHNLIFAKP